MARSMARSRAARAGERLPGAFVEGLQPGVHFLDAFLIGHDRLDRLRTRHGELRGFFG